MNKRIYQRLSDHEREEISRGLAAGKKQCEIACMLGRNPATISREISRNSGKSGYRAYSAVRRATRAAASRRRGKRRIKQERRLRAYILAGLKRQWSPREIVKRMKLEYPQDKDMHISHEAIYQYIYVLPRGNLRQTLIRALRQERRYRRKRGSRKGTTVEMRGKITDMLSIEERPEEVADRTIPGHWEGDLIMGKHKRTALGTLVERTSRYTILVPLGKNKDALRVRMAYAKALRSVPKELAQTLTYDQGKEMSEHKTFTIDTWHTGIFCPSGVPLGTRHE